MSHKFSIVIEMKGDKPVATAYLKVNAQEAHKHFLRLRDEEKEAYFFQHPIADRRSKSTEQVTATLGQRDASGAVQQPEEQKKAPIPEGKKNEVPMPAPKKRGNKIEGVSLDIDGTPTAVDM